MSPLYEVNDKAPQLGEGVFIASSASISGDVTLGRDASVFYGASLRGDTERIVVGERTNIQDNAVLHSDSHHACVVGDGVSIGHNAVVHGARIGDGTLIGMSATVLNGADVGEECLIAAGALVLQRQNIPPRSLVAGVPAQVRRELSSQELAHLRENAETYLRLKVQHQQARRLDEGA